MRTIFLAFALIFSLGNADSSIQRLVENGEYEEALTQARASAEQGDRHGQDWVGWFYENGNGVEANLDTAEYFYRAAAKQGQNHAQWRLGVLIDKGSIKGSLEEAVGFFEASAADDFIDAIVSLAVMQATGRGTPQDYPAALGNYMRAAQFGDDHAVRGVGIMLYLGQGIETNKEEAAAWFLVSAASGNDEGDNSFQMVAKELGRDDMRPIAARALEIAEELGIEVNIIIDEGKDPPQTM